MSVQRQTDRKVMPGNETATTPDITTHPTQSAIWVRSVVEVLLMGSAVQRPKLSRFGPRKERESKRIRRWAEVGFSAELDGGLAKATRPSRCA